MLRLEYARVCAHQDMVGSSNIFKRRFCSMTLHGGAVAESGRRSECRHTCRHFSTARTTRAVLHALWQEQQHAFTLHNFVSERGHLQGVTQFISWYRV